MGLGSGTRGGGAASVALLDVCFAPFGGARALARMPALPSETFPKVYALRQPNAPRRYPEKSIFFLEMESVKLCSK